MANPNDFSGEDLTSNTITSRMRRINELEGAILVERPIGLAALDSKLYTVERNQRVEVFNTFGVYQRIQWGFDGSGDGGFDFPWGISASATELYVTDTSLGTQDRVQVFDTNGVFDRKWGSSGTGDGQFDQPHGIAFYDDEIYVVDEGNHRVQVFDTNGVFLRKWGSDGVGDGQFEEPFGIAIYDNEVYITDIGSDRVQVFDTNGVFDRKWGSSGTGDGQFSGPLFVEQMGGEIYVSDYLQARVQVFDTDGVFDRKWGSAGTGDGEFDALLGPHGMAVIGIELYVSDRGNNRIQVFDADGVFQRQIDNVTRQTSFLAYQIGAPDEALGTPDSGVDVPALNALAPEPASGAVYELGADYVPEHITDMRSAVEALAPFYTNDDTGDPFNWIDEDVDNLYSLAVDRTDYGRTSPTEYDWTDDLATMRDRDPEDLDIGEPHECIVLLEDSDLV